MSDISILSGISGLSFDSTFFCLVFFISFLVLLPSPDALSVLRFILLMAHHPDFLSGKFFNIFLWEIGFFV